MLRPLLVSEPLFPFSRHRRDSVLVDLFLVLQRPIPKEGFSAVFSSRRFFAALPETLKVASYAPLLPLLTSGAEPIRVHDLTWTSIVWRSHPPVDLAPGDLGAPIRTLSCCPGGFAAHYPAVTLAEHPSAILCYGTPRGALLFYISKCCKRGHQHAL